MLSSYKTKFFIYFIVSFIFFLIPLLYLSFLATMVQSNNFDSNSILLNPNLPYLIRPSLIIANVFFILSCYMIVRGKGYTRWLTFFALLNIIGLAILIILPSKLTEKKIQEDSPAATPVKETLPNSIQ